MKSPFILLPVILVFSFISHLPAQDVPIGSWRDMLPYTTCNSVTEAGNRIYCSTPYSLFYYDKDDHSVVRITKITGLSDIGISCINYNKDLHVLLIAYTNANIDLIRDGQIINISDIKRKQILGNKTINAITFIDHYAYLSCGFGIVVLDLYKEEILDTYYIGKNGSAINVLGLVRSSQDTLFAATEKGLYKAWSKNPNLANFESWQIDPNIDSTARYTTLTWFADKLFVNKRKGGGSDTICYYSFGLWTAWQRTVSSPVVKLQSMYDALLVSYNYFVHVFDTALNQTYTVWNYNPGFPNPLDAIKDKTGHIWIADSYLSLIDVNVPNGTIAHITLSGPLTSKVYFMDAMANDLYIAPGGHDASYIPLYTAPQIYHFNNEIWYNLSGNTDPILSNCHDVVSVSIDPNDQRRVYAGTFGSGLLELYNDSVIRKYGESNSTLRHHSASDTSDVRVSGTTFDASGNLWVVTSHNNSCLSMKKGNQWTGFTIPESNENDLGSIIVDRYGQKWIIMRYGNLNPYSLLVFTDNGTPDNPADDHAKRLNSNPGNGNIPGNIVFAMAEDLEGEIWIGTEKGVAVFYSPENVFTGEDFDAQRILVEQGGYVQYLLENELVTAITIDGNNQKWIGTDRGGVFLFSPDGTKQIQHFTAEDSPLLSDRITSIAINVNGDVFLGTDKGIIAYRGTATPGGESNENVYAFPNPVKDGYDGYIAIKGLVKNAEVRITDVSGDLVYSTKAEGGQAIWNGRNFNGKKVKSGIYLVFASNETGSEKVVTKIVIIN